MSKKNKLSREQIQLLCDFSVFLALEARFEDIAYESPSFLNLSRKADRLNPAFVRRIQRGADIEVSRLLRRIPRGFLDSRVTLEYDGRSHGVVLSDGVFRISFSARFTGTRVKARCFGFSRVGE